MKILIFNWRDIKHPWAGGAEINIHELAKGWVKMGHTITFFCSNYVNKKLPIEEIIDGIKIIRKGGHYTVYFWAIIYYFLKFNRKFDFVVDLENGIPFFTPVFCHSPKLCIVHQLAQVVFFIEERFPINLLGYLLEKIAMPFVYKTTPFVAISETTKETMVRFGIPEENIKIIKVGIDHNIYVCGNEKFDQPTLLYVGRIRKYKRLNLLVDLIKSVKEFIPNVQLIIAGDGKDRVNLVNYINKFQLQHFIRVLGYVTKEVKVELLQKAWVLVNASLVEGWGLSVTEANACGTPAIAFNVLGIKDAIIDGETGLLTETLEQMAEKVVELLNCKELRIHLSRKSVQFAEQFSWGKSSEEYLKYMGQIIGGEYN